MEPRLSEPQSFLISHLVAFCRLLHESGLPVSPAQTLDLIAALSLIPLNKRDDVRAVAQALLVRRREELPVFATAFDFFWRGLGVEEAPAGLVELTNARQRRLRLAGRGNSEITPPAPPNEALEARSIYSESEALRHKDFAELSLQEIQQAQAVLRKLRWRPGLRRTRRWQSARRGNVDLRRSMRQRMAFAGELRPLARKQPATHIRPLVVLCDVSGSMERYSRMLLHFVHTLGIGLGNVETFVFGTRLTRITRQLRHRDVDEALAAVSDQVRDWGSGTRIGTAIKDFNYHWGRRVLGRGPIVLLISDGWDRGDPAMLSHEIARLQRSCQRLIWLNPLLGSPGYEPITIGMQAALPYIDDFLPIHNLVSLEQLAQSLATLEKRPRRR